MPIGTVKVAWNVEFRNIIHYSKRYSIKFTSTRSCVRQGYSSRFEKLIPLQNVKVEANIVDMIAEVVIYQTYKNVEDKNIEALYKFPIYEAAAICDFEAEIDGKYKVKGVVKEAKQAASDYNEAVEKGYSAYLLEEQLSDVFQCSIGNLKSNQTVVIKITYVTELKHDSENEKIRFVLPTCIAERYGSSSSSPSTITSTANDGKKLVPDDVKYSGEANYKLDLKVNCRMTSTIQSIESPSHLISTELNVNGNPKTSNVTLAEQITYLEKDFVLVVKSEDLDKPRSGSMQGEPIKKAGQVLELFLHSLSEDCYFNVISFGSKIYPGVRFTVYCILSKGVQPSNEIILTAKSSDGPMKLNIPIDHVTLTGSKIHTLAARKLIQDLEENRSFINKHPKSKDKTIPDYIFKDYIVNLGIKYNLISKYTSFIAIDEQSKESISQWPPEVRHVPNKASSQMSGWNYGLRTSTNPYAITPTSAFNIMHYEKPFASQQQQLCSPVSYQAPQQQLYFSPVARNKNNKIKTGILPRGIGRKNLRSPLPSSNDINNDQNQNQKEREDVMKKVTTKKEIKEHEKPNIETLLTFLSLQSFDGKFQPKNEFFEFFGKNSLDEFNFENNFENKDDMQQKVKLCTIIALIYLEVVMMKDFKDECDICYKKSKKALTTKFKDYNEENVKNVMDRLSSTTTISTISTTTAAPVETFQSIAKDLRSAKSNAKLLALDQSHTNNIASMTSRSLVDLQGNCDKKYLVYITFGPPNSVPPELGRIASSHISKNCPESSRRDNRGGDINNRPPLQQQYSSSTYENRNGAGGAMSGGNDYHFKSYESRYTKKCYQCGSSDHIARYCEEQQSRFGSGSGGGDRGDYQQRRGYNNNNGYGNNNSFGGSGSGGG
ncbi:21621_t:CDS:10, partial [Entrophospora sp. SA101]